MARTILFITLLVLGQIIVGPAVSPSPAAACSTAWSATYNSQSVSEIARRPGQVVQTWIWYRNNGCNAWGFSYPARLGTWNPEPGQDHSSLVGGSGSSCVSTGWEQCTRIKMDQTGNVLPGGLASFTFNIVAPSGPGSNRLYIRPVIDGQTWMEDYGVWWQIDTAQEDTNPGCRTYGSSVYTPDPSITFVQWTDCFTDLYTYDNHQGNARKFGGQDQGGCVTDSPFFGSVATGSVTYHTPSQNFGPIQSGYASGLCASGYHVWSGGDAWNQPIPFSANTDPWRSATIFSQWTCGSGCTPNYLSGSRDYYFP